MSYKPITPREASQLNYSKESPTHRAAGLGFLGSIVGYLATPLTKAIAPRKYKELYDKPVTKRILKLIGGGIGSGVGITGSLYADREKFNTEKYIYDTRGRAILNKTASVWNIHKTLSGSQFMNNVAKDVGLGALGIGSAYLATDYILDRSDMDPWKKQALSTGASAIAGAGAIYGLNKARRNVNAYAYTEARRMFNGGSRRSRPVNPEMVTDSFKNLGIKRKNGTLYKEDGTPITTKQEFKNHYKNLVKKNHPDMGGSNETMAKINNARDKFMSSSEFNKLAAFLTEKQKDKVKKTGVVAAGLGTTALGLSLAPAAASFSRSAFAAKRAKDTGSFAKALLGPDGAQVVGNYLEGADRFGRSPLGKALGAVLRNTKKVQEKVDNNSAGPISKALHKLYGKVGLQGNSFSNLHYSKFTQSKDVKDAAGFWLDVESFGVPKGRYEHAAKSYVKDNLGYVPKGMDPASFVDSLIAAKKISPSDLAKTHEVPSFKDASTVSESLKDLYKRKTQDKAVTDAFKEGINARVGIDKSNKAYINAIKDIGLNGTTKERKAVGKMALEKSLAGYPAGYAKATVGGTVGISSLGVGITYSGLKKDKK